MHKPISTHWSTIKEIYAILKVRSPMAFLFANNLLSLCMLSLMLIGWRTMTIVPLLVYILCFLVVIILSSSQKLCYLARYSIELYIGLLFLLLLNYVEFNLFFLNIKLTAFNLLLFAVIITVLLIFVQILFLTLI